MIKPIVRKPYKPNPRQLKKFAADSEAYRKKVDEEKAKVKPILERILLASEVELNSLEAALDCPCSCHPKAPTFTLHDGGKTCGCQLTKVERQKIQHATLRRLTKISQKISPVYQENYDKFKERADELNVVAKIEVSGAPFVIVGEVDGRGFYLRERHDEYRVTIAPDNNPKIDPWVSQGEVIDILSGDEEEFHSDKGKPYTVKALEIAVGAVRSYLRQSQCQHKDVATRYCPDCGKELISDYID